MFLQFNLEKICELLPVLRCVRRFEEIHLIFAGILERVKKVRVGSCEAQGVSKLQHKHSATNLELIWEIVFLVCEH